MSDTTNPNEPTPPDPASTDSPVPSVVDHAAWTAAQLEHLHVEKALTRHRDEVAAARRQLPWLEITTDYRFDTNHGERSLLDLFDGRDQMLMYHFMMGPDWEEGCPSCSFWADGYNGLTAHLAARDTALVVASRTSLANINAYKARMGWTFEWVSSLGSTFNFDFGVSYEADDADRSYNFGTQSFGAEEAPGLSAFIRRDDRVFLTQQVFSRGLDLFNSAYHMLDLSPLGRHEDALEWPMQWLRRADSY